ncbi:hypothetical protein IC232_27100 [Microvirga sp. BT688]|uniref:hypothetical protein n=1 Tax=Microvirga sp. TaxID=1873136 RepID=UPI00168610D7|nr:hypothetical protein [Microvirga sp.]MBD2750331.1 hypothetical protein [Microvirga sp.]
MSGYITRLSGALRQGSTHPQDVQIARLDAVIDRLRVLNQSSADLVHAIRHMMD